jgi:hypothetical protein
MITFFKFDSAAAQALSRRPLNLEPPVQFLASPCEIFTCDISLFISDINNKNIGPNTTIFIKNRNFQEPEDDLI